MQQLGEPDQAVELFQAVIREDPRSAEAHNWLGVAYAQKNHLLDSIAQFQQAVDLSPDYIEGYNNLGSTLARAQRMKDAIRVFRAGLALEPNNLALHLNLAHALRAKGNRDEALRELRSVLKEGDNAQVETAMAEILREKRDFPGAIEAAEKALKIDPGLDHAYETLGSALKAQAAAMPSRPSRHLPNAECKQRYEAGSELLARGDPQGAEKELKKAVEADPNYAEAHNLLGFVYGQSSNLPAALEQFLKAIALDPDLANAYYNLGVALWYGGQKDEARYELETAVRQNPAFGEAYSFLGMAARQTGDWERGRRDLERAISIDPDVPGPHIDLGMILLKTDQTQAACEEFQLVVRKHVAEEVPDLDVAIGELRDAAQQRPDDPLIHDTLGLADGHGGNDSQLVLDQFRKAIQLRPNFAAAHNHLGMALLQTGDDQQAIQEFRQALQFNPNDGEAQGNLGATLVSSNVDEAIAQLKQAIAKQPASIKAQYNLAMAYLQKYGVDKEIEQLQTVIAS